MNQQAERKSFVSNNDNYDTKKKEIWPINTILFTLFSSSLHFRAGTISYISLTACAYSITWRQCEEPLSGWSQDLLLMFHFMTILPAKYASGLSCECLIQPCNDIHPYPISCPTEFPQAINEPVKPRTRVCNEEHYYLTTSQIMCHEFATLSRFIGWGSLMHRVLTPLSWRSVVVNDLFASSRDSSRLTC